MKATLPPKGALAAQRWRAQAKERVSCPVSYAIAPHAGAHAYGSRKGLKVKATFMISYGKGTLA